jgi:hypothetical protein
VKDDKAMVGGWGTIDFVNVHTHLKELDHGPTRMANRQGIRGNHI